MSANLKELRKEAYKHWGLGIKKVVFDFPQSVVRAGQREFVFRLDYSDSNASWPRAYALALENQEEPIIRIIAPITMISKYNQFNLETTAWYDMPLELHEQIIRHVESNKLVRPIPSWQKWLNKVLPKNKQFDGKVNITNYMFAVSLREQEMTLRLL